MQPLTIKPAAVRPVTLTDEAVVKVLELIGGEEPRVMLRVGVRPGGCSGFSYEMFLDANIDDGDIVTDFNELKVVVDGQSAKMLNGATVDYRDGLMEQGFSISNPNITRSCGCGNSFA